MLCARSSKKAWHRRDGPPVADSAQPSASASSLLHSRRRSKEALMVRRSVVTWLTVSILLITPVASFAQGPLVVSVWGGNWKDTVEQIVAKPFTAKTGIPVEFEVGGT